MAVLKVKRVRLIAHDSHKEDLLKNLQRKGLLHLLNLNDDASLLESDAKIKSFEPNHIETDQILFKVNFILDFIGGFEEKKGGMMAALLKNKVEVSLAEFENIMNDVNMDDVYNRCHALSEEFVALESKMSKLKAAKSELLPWSPLELDLKLLDGTANTVVSAGQIPLLSLEKLESDLNELSPEISFEVVNKTTQAHLVLVVYMKSMSEKVVQVLGNYGFQPVFFPGVSGSPAETITKIDSDIEGLLAEKELLIERSKRMLSFKDNFVILKTYLESVRDRADAQSNFVGTEKVFMAEGWVLAEREGELKEVISKVSNDVDLSLEDPNKEDNPPVMLRNNKWITPFEVVTKLYGNPSYNEIDPTPLLAPFFIIFFGMAMGDVGYGLILTPLCLYLRKKLNVSAKIKDFLSLFAYGGVTTIIVGVLTGSWFTIESQHLPAFMRSMILVDPLADPVTFLVACFFIGIIHLFFGILIEMADTIKNKAGINAILTEPSKIILFSGLIILITQMVSGGGGLPANVVQIGKWLSIVGAVCLVWFSGAGASNIFTRIGGGLFNLYGMSAFIGDTISYSRLMALGLATFLVGWGINIIGGVVKELIPGVGVVVMIMIILGGHIFNLAINLISSFVHPARLQYVEFFSKFFDGGGQDFMPFDIKAKDILLKK